MAVWTGTLREMREIVNEPSGSSCGVEEGGSPGWARTSDFLINSQALYRLSYRGVSERTQGRLYRIG